MLTFRAVYIPLLTLAVVFHPLTEAADLEQVNSVLLLPAIPAIYAVMCLPEIHYAAVTEIIAAQALPVKDFIMATLAMSHFMEADVLMERDLPMMIRARTCVHSVRFAQAALA